MRALLIAVCIIAGLAAVAPAGAQDGVDLSADLAATLEDFRARYGFPGATAAIALPDGTVVTAATGLADVEFERGMTPETPMLAASIGKTFVAATVLALESEGRLRQADLLADHLGDRPWFGRLPNAETITIDHLLRHRAGLPDHVHLPEFQAAWARITAADGAVSPEELVGFVIGREPLFEAGTGWAYSDTGYVLLGLVIEAVTGRLYHEVVRERFLAPLALTGTFPSDRRDLPGLAIGYTAPGNPFGLPARTADANGRLLWNPALEWTGGGLASTSQDLARWGHLLSGGEALANPYLDRMLAGAPVAPDAPGILYGAGVAIYADTSRGPVYGHGGWIPGYVSSLRHYADHGITVAFQINTDAGVLDDTSDLAPTLEGALANLAIPADVLPLAERLTQSIPARMAADGVPGAIVVLIEKGLPVWTEAFGLADPAAGRTMTEATVFRVESISKSVTAWGVMQLVVEGDITLDDNVWDHVTSWTPPPDTPAMTLRQVLSGTAGLGLGDITSRYPPDGTVLSLRAFMSRDFEMIADPGSGFAYSNIGYNLLEILIEDVSGMPFSTFMAERVLRPMGATDAGFDWTEALAARMPVAHGLRGQRIAPHVYPGRASGGLLADIRDVAAFVRAGMGAPHKDARAGLPDAAIAQMHHPQVSLDGMFGLVAEGYGFGHFAETLSDGRHAVWHGGQGHGWMSHFHLVPESGDAIVILANSQRAWPLFAMILRDWSGSLGVEPVGMARVLQAGTAARMAIALSVAGAALALWVAVQGRPRRRVARIGAGGVALALIAWPLWAVAQEYLFLYSILPGLWTWLAAASGLTGLSLAAVALLPERMR